MSGSPVLEWDYSALAANYDARVDYDAGLLRHVIGEMGLEPGDAVLEVGAGTGKLTGLLCAHGLDVTAVEPNAAMRAVAMAKPVGSAARWIAGRGEALPVQSNRFVLVAYGSSFNVLPARVALDECVRVLREPGYWMALWNHRDLDDPLQRDVEAVIRRHLPDYDHGSRRRSPEADLQAHAVFGDIRAYEQRFLADIATDDWLAAWRSHATLQRQAGPRLQAILTGIANLVRGHDMLRIPYVTRAWTARR
ncbi:class I SAM-dependent methyltransferase [Dokdonella sp. MW10]|uniref:class I SAM-dependent methyltransferase n=1 Tax=Dokdonella sp. MW10 TaxID=2992926 RepID=UPI003F822313